MLDIIVGISNTDAQMKRQQDHEKAPVRALLIQAYSEAEKDCQQKMITSPII